MRLHKFFSIKTNFLLQQKMSFHTVFVYGTLKRGEPNHNWITSKENGCAKFISKAQTAKKYPLIIASKYNVPFLLHSPGTGQQVIGEVYEVDDKMLARLDVLEDHPTFYEREIEEVELIESDDNKNSKTIKCWIYFLKRFRQSLLSEEYLKEYSSTGPHGKPYTPRYLRVPEYHAMMDVKEIETVEV